MGPVPAGIAAGRAQHTGQRAKWITSSNAAAPGEDEVEVEVEEEVETAAKSKGKGKRPSSVKLEVKQEFGAPGGIRRLALAHAQSAPSRPRPDSNAIAEREAFVERKRSEMTLRDLACKAICQIKQGLRKPGVQANGKPFMPKTWDRDFKPMLGSYIKFLLTRPDQFRVAEGAGPGLYTIEDVTGNRTVVAPSWDELAASKGKGKFKGKGKGKEKDGKGKGKEGKSLWKGKVKGKDSVPPWTCKGSGKSKEKDAQKGSSNGITGRTSSMPRLSPRPPALPPPRALAGADEEEADADWAQGEEEELAPEEEFAPEELAEMEAEAEAAMDEEFAPMEAEAVGVSYDDEGEEEAATAAPGRGSLISALLLG
eukprot:TRINITY_DN969_c1_g2_i1.p1 TRINITY_DN969_c1_g2~~TRINITY_DN969_c1_g2_i1.p1  ORF type:complete len:396 (+),score=99.49 TRINITY_DN969_c1_g2_i1:86-1189(+)